MKGICSMCQSADRPVRPAGENEALVCPKCAGKNIPALMKYLAKKVGINTEGSQINRAVINLGGDRKQAADQITKALKSLIVNAYEAGIWIEKIETRAQPDGLEMEFNISLRREEEAEVTSEGKPSAEVQARCDA